VRILPPAALSAGLVVLLTDLAASASSLLCGHGIADLRGGWIVGAVRLIAHEGNPAAAWANSADAPPEWLLLLSFSVLVGVAILAGLRFWGWWMDRSSLHQGRRPRKQQGYLAPREAALRYGEPAARREAARLHPSLTASELRQRPIAELAIPLGRCGRFPVFASLEKAVAVLAGMRQGKTTGLLARLALQHRGPMVYTTTKPDDLRLFYEPPPGTHSRTFLFNPDELGGLGTVAFDPVIGCEDPETARLRAQAILARQRARGQERGLDWALLAEKLLKYLLHAAALEHLSGSADTWGMPRVVEWASAKNFEAAGVTKWLRQSPQAAPWASLLEEMGSSAPETLYSIKINLHEALVCWEDPGLLRRMSAGAVTMIDPTALVHAGDRLLVLGRPGGHSSVLITALVSAIVEAARQAARRAITLGGRLDPPLLLLLDEVAKVCPLPQMPELVTDCASQGIILVYALQSLEDGEEAWGSNRFQGMWSATNCQVVMGMVSGDRTLRALSNLSPTVKVEEARDSQNHRGERMDPVVRFERALTTDEIRGIAHHTGVLFYGPRPMLVSLPHVQDRASEVRALAEASEAAWLSWASAHQSGGDGIPMP
jgi:hypothetical protein